MHECYLHGPLELTASSPMPEKTSEEWHHQLNEGLKRFYYVWWRAAAIALHALMLKSSEKYDLPCYPHSRAVLALVVRSTHFCQFDYLIGEYLACSRPETSMIPLMTKCC